jgi:hypothetical protein
VNIFAVGMAGKAEEKNSGNSQNTNPIALFVEIDLFDALDRRLAGTIYSHISNC